MRSFISQPAGALMLALVLCSITMPTHGASKPASTSTSTSTLSVTPIAFHERRLANGLQVISVPSNASPTVSVQVWFHVGSKNDPVNRSGFAHLFEHLMFKSTRHLKSEQFDRMTEDVGGSNNAFTNDDVTAFQDLVPSNHLETLLWAEAERMSNLEVVQDNFASERAVVEEEYRQRILASPYGRFSNAIPAVSYLVHPYKRPTIGRIEDLDAATLADVTAFHSTWYRPDNATLVIAGDFDPTQLDAWVDKYFGRIPKPSTPLPKLAVDEPAWTQDRRVEVTGPTVPLPAVALTWLAPPVTSPDVPALQIAAALLSSGESSRLNQALVYREQIAGEASFEADLRAGPGLLIATAIASNGHTPAQLEQSLIAEIKRLATGPIGVDELAKIKTQLLTSALLTRQTPAGLSAAFAEAAVMEGDPSKANTDLTDLQKVSAADVHRVLRRYVLDAHHVTVTYRQAPAAAGTADIGAAK